MRTRLQSILPRKTSLTSRLHCMWERMGRQRVSLDHGPTRGLREARSRRCPDEVPDAERVSGDQMSYLSGFLTRAAHEASNHSLTGALAGG